MQQFAILAGLPGSGKSSLAKRLHAEDGFFVVSSDGIRLALNAGVYPRDDQNGSYTLLEPIVWGLVDQAVANLLRAGKNVAIDATNLTQALRANWRDLARAVAPDIRVVIWWCNGNWDSAHRWAEERGHNLAEYLAIRGRLEAGVEPPIAQEADELHFFPNQPVETPSQDT